MGATLPAEICACIRRALEEDLGSGDVTTNQIVPANATLRAQMVAKQEGIVAGLEVAGNVFRALDEEIWFELTKAEGSKVAAADVLVNVLGSARALLAGERTALNFVGRMSGIATLTREFVRSVSATKATILDTRKTAPGLRAIDKLAVRLGGGQNHRMGLYDMVLIKDNHIDFAGSLTEAVRRIRACDTELPLEVETRTLRDVSEALALGVQRILLDNMTVQMMRDAVKMNSGQAKFEASGNITLENVRQIAETGVDFISVGALTHSPRVFDVTLRWTA